MTVSTLQSMLLWCVIINYALLIIWFVAFLLARDFIYRLHSRWFRLSVEQFDALMYGSMTVYKIGVLLLNLVPLIALWIVY
jgi:hypothetical protein